jgi:hypothetical protein
VAGREPNGASQENDLLHLTGRFQRGPAAGSSPLQSAGGGGTFDDMLEARVAALEKDVEYIKRDVGELRSDVRDIKTGQSEIRVTLATLTERVGHLPSKGYINTVVMAGFALTTAALLFQKQILTFLGLSH